MKINKWHTSKRMALVNIREVYPQVSLGLWQIDESVDEFYARYPWLERYKEDLSKHFQNDGRKLEFLAVRVLLREMLLVAGCSEAQVDRIGEITHRPDGKPLLKGYHISVSHTKGFAAVILSKQHEVAVDVEYFSDRVERIASKFLRKDEKPGGLDELLVHWCSKETVFKLFSDAHLQFSQMRVLPFDTMSDWACEVENLKAHTTVRVDFELTMEFVLTYALLP